MGIVLYIIDLNIFTQQKNYKAIAATQSELEVLLQEEAISPVVTASNPLEENQVLREENKRQREQQSLQSSTAFAELETQIKALRKENTSLCKMAIKAN